MKTIKSVLVTGIIISFLFGCDAILDKLDIEIEAGKVSKNFTINPDKAGEYTFMEEVIQSDIRQEIENAGYSYGDIEKITVKEVKLTIVSGATNFNIAGKMEAWLLAEGMADKMIASKNPVPENVSEFTMDLYEDNLKSFLGKDEYTIKLIGTLEEDLTQEVEVRVTVSFTAQS